ncbi:FecR domain-containing protein [Verrucomicrobium sp. GAS474]|uniref:FecR domain-containing protein n=1 Tax=Verrucomicrobium sp. GAS474 TaxID=1882831 RepID=UPI0012FF728E|nr:FecR domain-containing protein [Verrucomicrobium sp. GAS474]
MVGLAASFAGPLPLQAQSTVPPPTQLPQTPQQAAQVPPRGQMSQGHLYPKNLAQQLLGTRIRVNQSAGLRMINGFPPPATAAGTLDVSSLLTSSFDGLELAPGFHSITITLAKPMPVNRVAFVNMEATGTFNVLIGASDPQLQPTPPTKQENALAGPSMVNYAVFQPQMAKFIQIEFRVVRPGRIARLGVYGLASALDFAVRVGDEKKDGPAVPPAPGGLAATPKSGAPGGTPALPPTKEVSVDMANISSGTRVSRVSSGAKGSEPNQMIADALGSSYTFNAADPAPTVDLDFKGKRKVSSASIVMAGPPARVELIRASPPPPVTPSSGIATVTRVSGVVETLSIDGTGQSPAKPGDVLLPGRVLRTSFNSSAELDIDGKSLLRVGPNSSVTLRIGTAAGAEVSVLRGTVLWQVFTPGGGGRLITPSSVATITGTTIIAEVKLNGASTISLLETSRADGVQVNSTTTGETYTLHPGESTSIGSGGAAGAGGSNLAVQPFVIQKAWDQSPVGAGAGPLRNGVDQVFVPGGIVPTPPDEGEVLATTTTKGGFSEAKLDFAGQSLDGVRVRITPLPGGPADTPITVVSVGVSGQYQVQDLDYAYQGRSVATLAAAETAAGLNNPNANPAGNPALAANAPGATGTPAAPGANGAPSTPGNTANSAAGTSASAAVVASAGAGTPGFAAVPGPTGAGADSTAGGSDDGRTVAQVAEQGGVDGTAGEPVLKGEMIPQSSVYHDPYSLYSAWEDPTQASLILPVNLPTVPSAVSN